MVDTRQQRAIRRTVRQVNNEWYRAGMPRQARRRKAEELRTHLWEALADGRSIGDVVGTDPQEFAAAWAAADRSHPVLGLSLQVLAAVTLIPGVIALLNPWLHPVLLTEDDRVGVPAGLLGALAIMVPFFLGLQVLRLTRHRLTRQRATMILLVGVLVYAAVLATWTTSDGGSGRLVVISPATAWTLVIIGTVAQALASWLKRSRWR
jgi:cation transport ATPase